MRLIVFCMVLSNLIFSQEIPEVSFGRIERIENFQSQFVTPRTIDVWLPEDYSTTKKYAVLYMHDGQMLYDATQTWNKQAWEVDEVLAKLHAENKIQDIIVVGIWNGGATRHSDYFPQKAFELLSKKQQDSIYSLERSPGVKYFNGSVTSDNYLKFMVQELKPLIDGKYAVHTSKEHTFVAGSSMGGLISMYAICEYPSVFGGAACISTHWPGIFQVENNPIPTAFYRYLEKHLPNPKEHRIYFDFGTATLDALYEPLQKEVDAIMLQKGYNVNNWLTKKFEGENHSEMAWQKRLHFPFVFLFGI
ncbi:alpha/beta hydrolase [Flavobacterium sp. N2820]|uniref:alpha/beta hydrolase n=1 Tax=Flavobacterium sp. N2820 TaxID=2986834 RepID=UPI0022244BDE|nr:alpha/beta hydrolase-fold protein [Flavobacterium sp. N2820]